MIIHGLQHLGPKYVVAATAVEQWIMSHDPLRVEVTCVQLHFSERTFGRARRSSIRPERIGRTALLPRTRSSNAL
jgi:hypothetical protein